MLTSFVSLLDRRNFRQSHADQAFKATDMEQKEELAEFDESVPLTAEDEEGNVTTVMEATTYDGETLTELEEALSQLTKGQSRSAVTAWAELDTAVNLYSVDVATTPFSATWRNDAIY